MLKKDFGRLLSQHTSLNIGGPVFCWLEPEDIDEVLGSVSLAEDENRPLTIIGRGTNILAQDQMFDGVVVNLGRGFSYVEKENDGIVRIGASTPVWKVVNRCAELGLTGCEFLSGIPGSFGGAIFMNAGVRVPDQPQIFREMKEILLDIDIADLESRKRMNIKKEEAGFSYRSSGLAGKCILGARIRLDKDKKSSINKRIDSFMKRREWIRRLNFPSAGSIFKNPSDDNPAGRLIEECGLKGRRTGGAQISDIHANFIVNTGKAKAKDVLDLIELAKESVKDKFGIDLELELKII